MTANVLSVPSKPTSVSAWQRRRRPTFRPYCSANVTIGAGTRLFVARKFAVDVGEDGPPGRSAKDYVRLPAERYNLLDSKAVQRVAGKEGTFRVSTGMQRMLMFEAEPVGYISIVVKPDGVEQRLISAELVSDKPSSLVDEINATLNNVQLTNTVSASPRQAGKVQLVCQLELRGMFTQGVLSKVPEARLNGLMSWALGALMPWFLAKLRTDYRRWAAGEDRTSALGTGELAMLARSLMTQRGALPEGIVELDIDDERLAGALVKEEAPTDAEAPQLSGTSVKSRPLPLPPRGFKKL